MVEQRGGGEVRGSPGALLADLPGGPLQEGAVHRGGAWGPAGEPQQGHGRGPAGGSRTAETEAEAFEGRYGGDGAEKAAPGQPGPVRPAPVQGVRAFVGPVRPVRGPGPAAERPVALVQGDARTGLGGGNRGGEAGEAAADDVDVVHGWISFASLMMRRIGGGGS